VPGAAGRAAVRGRWPSAAPAPPPGKAASGWPSDDLSRLSHQLTKPATKLTFWLQPCMGLTQLALACARNPPPLRRQPSRGPCHCGRSRLGSARLPRPPARPTAAEQSADQACAFGEVQRSIQSQLSRGGSGTCQCLGQVHPTASSRGWCATSPSSACASPGAAVRCPRLPHTGTASRGAALRQHTARARASRMLGAAAPQRSEPRSSSAPSSRPAADASASFFQSACFQPRASRLEARIAGTLGAGERPRVPFTLWRRRRLSFVHTGGLHVRPCPCGHGHSASVWQCQLGAKENTATASTAAAGNARWRTHARCLALAIFIFLPCRVLDTPQVSL